MSIVTSLQKQIAALQTQIRELQNACVHPSVALTRRRPGSDINYDIREHSKYYWHAVHCGLCDKRWTEVKGEGEK